MPLAATEFVADAMLGTLARKLRAFGVDTVYYRKGTDEGLLNLAREGGRIILTSDRGLARMAESWGVRTIFISGRTDGSRLSSLLKGANASGVPVRRGPPLCSICNGRLTKVSRVDAAQIVPPAVWRRHRLFYRCSSCGHIYWRGSHWKKLSNLERAFRRHGDLG